MDKKSTCPCQLKWSLEESADPYTFLADHYPMQGVLDKLNELSKPELECACCLLGTALLRMSHKRSFWGMLSKRKPK